jgi:hypothetical protein
MKTELKTKNSAFCILHSALKNNSGASLLFVLAVMFLLLSIGASVLLAAGAGRGALARQAEHNQLMLLDESVQRNIMHSLQSPEEDSLGAQIVWAVFETGGELGDIELDMDFGGDFDADEVNAIRLNILQQDVKLGEESPQSFTEIFEVDANGEWILDENGLPISTGEWEVTQRIPRTAIVSVRLIVEVEITIGDRTMVSEAEYLLIGQEGLTDADPNHPVCTPSCRLNCPGNFSTLRLSNGGGQWTLERRGVMIHGLGAVVRG